MNYIRIDNFQKHDIKWKITLWNKYSAKCSFLKKYSDVEIL